MNAMNQGTLGNHQVNQVLNEAKMSDPDLETPSEQSNLSN